MPGLFSTFNIATRGLSAQQKAIDVTSHNIANANTEGYSRQRATMETTRPFGMPSLNNSIGPGQLGTGVEISSITRVRDTFLDYQVRVETSTQGQFQARDTYLGEVENILNEPSDTGLSTLIGKFFDSWQVLSGSPQNSNARTVVAQQSAALADALNHDYTALQKLKENVQLVQGNEVFEINNILNQIHEVNQQIKDVTVVKSIPNDLMDKRDLLLDQLSSKFNIKVDKQSFECLDVQPILEGPDGKPANSGQLVVKAVDAGGGASTARRFSYAQGIEPTDYQPGVTEYKVKYYKNGDTTSGSAAVNITITGIDSLEKFRQLSENRVFVADKDGNILKKDGTTTVKEGESASIDELNLFNPFSGSMKGYTTVQSDIDRYTDELNQLAKALAFSVNAIHSGKTDAAGDSVPFFINSQAAAYDSSGKLDTTKLSDVLSAEKNITAQNISINNELLKYPEEIKTKLHDNEFDRTSDNYKDGNTTGPRALAIAQLRDKLINVTGINITINERKDMFDPSKGGNVLINDDTSVEFKSSVGGTKIDNYFKDSIDKLGIQEQEAKRMVKNQEQLLAGFQEQKDSISGVSLDEEMANMVQFQHAYQANAKIISVVDQLLDVVVNGLVK